jgi:hypothetical protein
MTKLLFAELDPAPPELVEAPVPEGLRCPKCKTARFRIYWQTFTNQSRHIRLDCASCGGFVRYLPQDRGPGQPMHRCERRPSDASKPSLAAPPESWCWIGLIRQDDEVWRTVALAPTLEGAWDCLLHYPGTGDLLCIPSRPSNQGPANVD